MLINHGQKKPSMPLTFSDWIKMRRIAEYCAEACGRKTFYPEGAGWFLVPVLNNWRCIECQKYWKFRSRQLELDFNAENRTAFCD